MKGCDTLFIYYVIDVNPFTADPVKVLQFAIRV